MDQHTTTHSAPPRRVQPRYPPYKAKYGFYGDVLSYEHEQDKAKYGFYRRVLSSEHEQDKAEYGFYSPVLLVEHEQDRRSRL
jgi:hypothetical protein